MNKKITKSIFLSLDNLVGSGFALCFLLGGNVLIFAVDFFLLSFFLLPGNFAIFAYVFILLEFLNEIEKQTLL